MEHEDKAHESKEATKQTAIDPIVLASGASVLLSWYFFFIKGDRQRGLFVGLWPPTLMAFASYFRGARMEQMLRKRPGSVVSRVQERLPAQVQERLQEQMQEH